MPSIFLMTGSDAPDWLPLIFPLVIIVGAIMFIESLGKYIKKRNLIRENKLMNEHAAENVSDHDLHNAE